MKTELMYATTCGLTVYFNENCDMSYGQWRDTRKTLMEAINTAEAILDTVYPNTAEKVVIWDFTTGEVLAECSREHEEEEDYDCDWGYNEDMGYDPYLGCYTDDC